MQHELAIALPDQPIVKERRPLNSRQAWKLLGYTVGTTIVLIFGAAPIVEATGIPVYALLFAAVSLGVVLLFSDRTRLFGLALLISVVLTFIAVLAALSQIA